MKISIIHIKSGIDQKYTKLYDTFIRFLQKEFPLKNNLKIYFLGDRMGHMTTGARTPDNDLKILRASERIKKIAKRKLDRTIVEKFKNGDMVRVLMSSLYSKIRMKIKEGKGKLLISKYSPDIYTVVETPEPVGEHKDFMKDRYMLLDGNDKYVLQEIKLNDPNKKRSAKLFFGSELLRVGENNNDNMTNKKFNNEIAFNINDGNFEEYKKAHNPKPIPKPKKIIDEPIKKIIEPRPTRIRTKNKNIFNDDFIN
jgi:hypothetical protein